MHYTRTSEETQRLANRRGARNHKKRHSVNRERSYEKRTKSALAKEKIAARAAKFAAYKRLVRLYWQGERDGHPPLP